MKKKQLLALLEQFGDEQEIAITSDVRSVGAALCVADGSMEVLFNLTGVDASAGEGYIALTAHFGD